MSAPPYMKLYIADYLGDTHHLGALEHGAYLLLLMGMWRAGGSLPAADANLAKLARCSPDEWAAIKPIVLAFFKRSRSRITHKRLTLEMDKYDVVSRRRSEAAKRTQTENALKNKGPDEAIAKQLQPKPEPEPEPDIREEISDANASSGGEAAVAPEIKIKPKDEVREAFDLWNDLARRAQLPTAKTLDKGRREAIKVRLRDGGLEAWKAALAAVEASALCRGENDRHWRADIDFVCQRKSWLRLQEGFYGGLTQATGPPVPLSEAEVQAQQAWAEEFSRQQIAKGNYA